MTRADSFFRDNHTLSQTLFDKGGCCAQLLLVSFPSVRRRRRASLPPSLGFDRHQPGVLVRKRPLPHGIPRICLPHLLFHRWLKDRQGSRYRLCKPVFNDRKHPPDFFRIPLPMVDQGLEVILTMHPLLPGGNIDGR